MLTADFIGGLATGEGCFSLSVRRQVTRKGTRVLSILPSFQLSMKDEETMNLLAESLRANRIPIHRVRSRSKDGVFIISVQGLKRMAVLLPWIIPHLSGAKKKAAEHVHEYVKYRLSLPPKTPVSQTDLDFLFVARSLNGNSGAKFRALGAEYLSRILRDSTSGTEKVKI